MPPPPIACFFLILLISLFTLIIIGWCCRKCVQRKTTMDDEDDFGSYIDSRRCVTAIDVQTGRPVLVRNVRILTSNELPSYASRLYPGHEHRRSLYGTMVYDQPGDVPHVLSRTPPPPYSVNQAPRMQINQP